MASAAFICDQSFLSLVSGPDLMTCSKLLDYSFECALQAHTVRDLFLLYSAVLYSVSIL